LFIRRNKNLQHLKIANVGLQFEELIKVFRTIEKNKTIQAVHLCNNPGLLSTDALFEAKEIFNPINLSNWTSFRTMTTYNSEFDDASTERNMEISQSKFKSSKFVRSQQASKINVHLLDETEKLSD